ncbi:MAG: tetratricopeptide repeat protein [Elusimicrobiales bacterium]|nr:tetratricopeptide repeat protein [Elusimicrobiales bacterium]
MSYEQRPVLKDALKKLINSYGAPLGLGLIILLAALYLLLARGRGPLPEFPRERGDFMQAARAERRLAELAKQVAQNPEDIRALDESGRLKFQLGAPRYVEAIADLERARALGLADPRAFYYLGVMYQAVGLYDFAAQEYRRFLNNFPGDAEVRMLLAKLYYSSGDYPGAVREYEALLRDGAGDPVLLENLALARWKNKQDPAAALAELRSKGAPGAFLADYAEGRIKYELKEYPAAQALLARAASAAPGAGAFADQAALYWLAGDAAYKNKDAAAARGYLLELLKASPGHEEGKALLAKAEKALAAAEKARLAAEKAAAKAAAKKKK